MKQCGFETLELDSYTILALYVEVGSSFVTITVMWLNNMKFNKTFTNWSITVHKFAYQKC